MWVECILHPHPRQTIILGKIPQLKQSIATRFRGRSRGRVQGVRTPPPRRDDLRLSNTTGILLKNKSQLCHSLLVQPPPKKNPGSTPSNTHGKFLLPKSLDSKIFIILYPCPWHYCNQAKSFTSGSQEPLICLHVKMA